MIHTYKHLKKRNVFIEKKKVIGLLGSSSLLPFRQSQLPGDYGKTDETLADLQFMQNFFFFMLFNVIE